MHTYPKKPQNTLFMRMPIVKWNVDFLGNALKFHIALHLDNLLHQMLPYAYSPVKLQILEKLCGPIAGTLNSTGHLGCWIGGNLSHLVSNCKSQWLWFHVSKAELACQKL